MRKILITGAAGRVGSALRPFLRARYELRLFDLIAVEDGRENEVVVTGDITRPADLERALEGVSAVVHLACVHGEELAFERSLDVNYRALLALLEGVVQHGVERFVYASSHHVLGLHGRDGFPGDTASLAPDSVYGLSKAFGEAACAMYAYRHSIATLVIRIGNCDPTVSDDRVLRLWTSARDLANLVVLGLTSDAVHYDIVYGTSICPSPMFENARAAELGYVPLDLAEDHISPTFRPYEAMAPELGRDRVGGRYAAPRASRAKGPV